MMNKRQIIMMNCPEGFEDALKDFIDDMENDLGCFLELLDVRSLDDLGNISECYEQMEKLKSELY